MAFIFALLCLPLNALPTTEATALPSETAAVAASTLFEDAVSTDKNNADGIWKEYNEYIKGDPKCYFHIENLKGFQMLQRHTMDQATTFSSNYVYLLENDITTNIGEHYLTYYEEFPLSGVFDGQGHTLTLRNDDGTVPFIYYAENFSLQNIEIKWMSKRGVIFDNLSGTNNFSHVKISEQNISAVTASGVVCRYLNGKLTISDCNYINNNGTFGSYVTILNSSSELYIMDSIIIVGTVRAFIGRCEAGTKLYFNNFLFECSSETYLINAFNTTSDLPGDLTCVGCEFNINTSSKLNSFIIIKAGPMDIKLYDCSFGNNMNLFANRDVPTDLNSGSRYYYQGVYKNGSVFDPNFTPSKWFTGADGKPHLRYFYWPGQVAVS